MSKTAFVFPGQGSQYVGMGKDLYDKSPAAKAVFEQVDKTLGFSFSSLIFEGKEEELTRTANAQPALLTMSMAVLAALDERCPGIVATPAVVAGHSLGEYTALAASGALTVSDAIYLARRRGELMQKAGDNHPGGMAAVIGLDTEQVEQVAKDCGVYIANYNCKGQIIISGAKDAIDMACGAAEEAGCIYAVPLNVSGAFHSPLMKDAQEGLNKELETVAIQAPKIPLVGNTEAKVLCSDTSAIRAELKNQLCHSVLWDTSVSKMTELGVDTFVEIGPGNVLSKLIGRICPEAKTMTLGTWEEIYGFSIN